MEVSEIVYIVYDGVYLVGSPVSDVYDIFNVVIDIVHIVYDVCM